MDGNWKQRARKQNDHVILQSQLSHGIDKEQSKGFVPIIPQLLEIGALRSRTGGLLYLDFLRTDDSKIAGFKHLLFKTIKACW